MQSHMHALLDAETMREVRTQTAKDTRRTQRETALNKHRDLDNLSDDDDDAEVEVAVPAVVPTHVDEHAHTLEADVSLV